MSDIFIFGEGLEMNLICFSLEFPQRSSYQLQSYVDNAFILHVVIFSPFSDHSFPGVWSSDLVISKPYGAVDLDVEPGPGPAGLLARAVGRPARAMFSTGPGPHPDGRGPGWYRFRTFVFGCWFRRSSPINIYKYIPSPAPPPDN